MNVIPIDKARSAANLHMELVCPKLQKAQGQRIYHADSTPGKLFKYKDDANLRRETRVILAYLYTNIEDVIKGEVSTLERIKQEIDQLQINNQLSQILNGGIITDPELKRTLEECFNYTSYSSSEKPYKTLSIMGFDSCPYCNRQYVLTYITPQGKTRATLDHFFNKSSYPYLALSFFNLIPSCYTCNSSFKSDTEFSINTHINPYIKSFENHAKFTITFSKASNAHEYITQFYQNEDFLEINFVATDGSQLPNNSIAKGNIDIFQLKGLYNLHKDLVIEILQKQVIYNQGGYAKTLSQTFPKLFNNENDILKLILGNYIQVEDLHKRPFSRLTKDICEEIGLTQEILNDLLS